MKEQSPHIGQIAIAHGPPVPEFVLLALLFGIVFVSVGSAFCAFKAWRGGFESKGSSIDHTLKRKNF